jgi:hypothetical protein
LVDLLREAEAKKAGADLGELRKPSFSSCKPAGCFGEATEFIDEERRHVIQVELDPFGRDVAKAINELYASV